MKKLNYFDQTEYLKRTYEDLGLGELDAFTKMEIMKMLEQMFVERTMKTLFDVMTKDDQANFEKLVQDNPEMDQFVALMLVAETMDGLKEKLEENLFSLHEELVHDAKLIKEKIAKNK